MIKIIGIFLCISLTSFVNPSVFQTVTDAPKHNSPMIKVKVSENKSQEIEINLNIEKVFLVSQKLTDKQLKVKILDFKKYMATHFKLYLNEKEQKIKLKSISGSRLRVTAKYKIAMPDKMETLKLFSDCMSGMESHDRMPVSINIRNIEKKFNLNSKRNEIQVVF